MSRTCASPRAATVMDIQGEEQHVEDGWAGVSDAPLTGSRTRALTHANTYALSHTHTHVREGSRGRERRLGNQCKAHQRGDAAPSQRHVKRSNNAASHVPAHKEGHTTQQTQQQSDSAHL